jgi:hypothetical protein
VNIYHIIAGKKSVDLHGDQAVWTKDVHVHTWDMLHMIIIILIHSSTNWGYDKTFKMNTTSIWKHRNTVKVSTKWNLRQMKSYSNAELFTSWTLQNYIISVCGPTIFEQFWSCGTFPKKFNFLKKKLPSVTIQTISHFYDEDALTQWSLTSLH